MMHAKTSVMDGRGVPVSSTYSNPLGLSINYELDAIIEELRTTRVAERAGRTMDHESESSFERLRAAGYM